MGLSYTIRILAYEIEWTYVKTMYFKCRPNTINTDWDVTVHFHTSEYESYTAFISWRWVFGGRCFRNIRVEKLKNNLNVFHSPQGFWIRGDKTRRLLNMTRQLFIMDVILSLKSTLIKNLKWVDWHKLWRFKVESYVLGK